MYDSQIINAILSAYRATFNRM